MKKLVLLALCFVFMLTACSNYRVEITEPESSTETEKITEMINFPYSNFPKLTAEMQGKLLSGLEKIAEEFRSGQIKTEFYGAEKELDFAFPEPITAEDFSLLIVESTKGEPTRYGCFFPANDHNGIGAYDDRVRIVLTFAEGEWNIEHFYFCAAEEAETEPDHTAYKTGFGAEYVNEELGIRVNFSENWKDNYTAATSENCVTFFFKNSGEELFSIKRTTHEDWENMKAENKDWFPYSYIEETTDWVYYYSPILYSEWHGPDADFYRENMADYKMTVTILKTNITVQIK